MLVIEGDDRLLVTAVVGPYRAANDRDTHLN
jgi:hypothetical protein